MKRLTFLISIFLFLLAACAPTAAPAPQGGPVLIQQSTLAPTLIVPTSIFTGTPSHTPMPDAVPNLEIESPLQVVTLQVDSVVVTPTPPPSKTPSVTPTITATATNTPFPTPIPTATPTVPLFPTSVIVPVIEPTPAFGQPIINQPIIGQPPVPGQPPVVGGGGGVVCSSQWFFLSPSPSGCPAGPPSASSGAYQEFENGFMIWMGALNAIYVVYNDAPAPRWEVYRDVFDDQTMPADDPQYAIPPREGLHQPRRGFGLVWRSNDTLRQRLGWATTESEIGYTMNTQQAVDGTLFMGDPFGRTLALFPGGGTWQRYGGSGN